MTEFSVSFPGLGIGPFTIDKIAFSIGDIDIRWYGIILTLGIIAGLFYALYRCGFEGIKQDDIIDYALWTIILAIIGARSYYVLTTLKDASGNWNYHSLYDVIAIWEGGIAMYGSIIGGAASLLIVSKVKKFNKTQILKVFDMVSPGVMLGQIIGRWGNFCNGEAHGIVTPANFPLRMGLMGYADTASLTSMTYYHPTFLYESVWNLIGFALINVFYKKKKFDGQVMLMYLSWYGLGRMFIEGLRTDSLYIGAFRISQVVAFLCFVICTTVLVLGLIRARRRSLDGEGYAPLFEKLRGVKLTSRAASNPDKAEQNDVVTDEKENENGKDH